MSAQRISKRRYLTPAISHAGGGAGVKDAPAKKGKAPAPEAEEEEGGTFYDAMKKEMGGRIARTRAALDALDDEQRLLMEGHRPGAYLRLSFTGASDTLQAPESCFSIIHWESHHRRFRW